MSGLTDFYALLREIQRLSAWVLPAAGITPVLAALAGLSPPWPNAVGVTVLTSAVVLLALALVFQGLRRRSRRTVNRGLVVVAAMLVVAAGSYFWLFSLLVYSTSVTHEAFVGGFACTPAAELVYAEKCPRLDVDDIRGAGYEATRLWTAQSLATARLALLASWFAMSVCYAVALGAFVTHQMDAQTTRRRPAQPV